MDTLARLKSIISEELICQPVDLNDTDTFTAIGLDSMDLTELVLACEETFHVEIFNEVLEAFPMTVQTIGDLHQTILRAQGTSAA
jgi:acyl carrier protein